MTMFRLPRAAHLWLPGYARHSVRRRLGPRPRTTVDIMFGVADHFEPNQGSPSPEIERARTRAWIDGFPRLARRFTDADGVHPQHTFFIAPEGNWREHVEALRELCRAGYGELEVHLHHDSDTPTNLARTLNAFTGELADRYGMLARTQNGRVRYGFVHGNWALDNARPDGRWCGVNGELTVLRDTGCYGDFTLPCAPDLSQTRTVNSIYYATDDPTRARSHDYGRLACVGRRPGEESLLLLQGPLCLDWTRRKWGLLPRLDNAAVDASNLPSVDRFRLWVTAGVTVRGRPEWVFVKVHTHGAREDNAAVMLGAAMEAFHASVNSAFNDGHRYRLHYVTMREMVNIVAAAEAGERGNPGRFRDYRLTSPARRPLPFSA